MSFHQDGDAPGLLSITREVTGEDSLFPVHRLDRLTSGLILLARSAQAASKLGHLLATGGIEKYYLALSNRQPSKKQGLIQGSMLKGRNGSWRLGPINTEAPVATTQFFSYGLGKILAQPGAEAQTIRLFVVRPRTGKTHQIRVALKSLGSPILGDERYGGGVVDRAYLHAYALRFCWHGEMVSFIQPPNFALAGDHFISTITQQLLEKLGMPWKLAWPTYKTLHSTYNVEPSSM
jgi:tRNA pseudouridine32 synthase/23S rRNA pseudouridine746 synthase